VIRRAAALAACAFLLAAVGAGPAAASPGLSQPALLGLPINTPPVPLPDAYSVVHDTKLHVERPGVLANDLDADGDKIEAKLVNGPDHGKVDLNHDGSFTYEPDHGYTGLDGFTYAADDGKVKVPALVAITVTNVAPVGHNDSYSMKQGAKLDVPRPGVLGNDDDADGDRLTAKLVNGPDHGNLDLHEQGEFDYEPAKSFAGTDVFTYRVLDGADQSAVIRVVIDVVPKATPPPTPDPTPTPAPTPTPEPTRKPDKPKDPDPSREPRPTPPPDSRGGGHDNGAAGGSGGKGDGGKGSGGGNGGNGGPQPTVAIGRPATALRDEIGLAHVATDGATGPSVAFDAGMAAAFDGFAWQVPALVLSVPGLLVVFAVGLQVLGALAWVPLVRRRLGGDEDGLTPPERRA
jgi:hypothetical protein